MKTVFTSFNKAYQIVFVVGLLLMLVFSVLPVQAGTTYIIDSQASCESFGGTWVAAGVCDLPDPVTVVAGDFLDIRVIVQFLNSFSNDGTVLINSTGRTLLYVTSDSSGYIENNGTLQNFGNPFTNTGTIVNQGTFRLSNHVNNGSLQNNGTIEMDGQLINNGIIDNSGTIGAGDVIVNNGTINTCSGSIFSAIIGNPVEMCDPDNDGDGFLVSIDCNDADASIYPGAPEIINDGIDQDCSGADLTTQLAIENLAQTIINLNLKQGINNSLDAKLNSALQALNDLNENNNVAAINSLQAFVNAVEAQRGKELTDAQANTLIQQAQAIIASI